MTPAKSIRFHKLTRVAAVLAVPMLVLTASPSAYAGGSSNATIIGGERVQGQVIQAGGRSGNRSSIVTRSSRSSSSANRSAPTVRRELGFASGSAGLTSGAGYTQPGGRRSSRASRTIEPSRRAENFTDRFDSLRERFRRQTFGQVPGTRTSSTRLSNRRQNDFRQGPRLRQTQLRDRRNSRAVNPRRTNPASSFSRNSRQRFRR